MDENAQRLIRLLIRHLIFGAVGGIVFGILVMWFDIGQIRSLAMRSEQPWLVLGMFFFALFATFGAIGMGIGVMTLGKDD